MLKIKHLKMYIQWIRTSATLLSVLWKKRKDHCFLFLYGFQSFFFFRQVFRKPMQKLNQKTNKKTTTRLCFIIKTCETETMASIFLLPLPCSWSPVQSRRPSPGIKFCVNVCIGDQQRNSHFRLGLTQRAGRGLRLQKKKKTVVEHVCVCERKRNQHQ